MSLSTLNITMTDELKEKTYSSIRAKLNEIMDDQLDETDDTLLDYVTLLVANQRTEKQVVDELEPFINDASPGFVSWLWQYLSQFVEQPREPTPSPPPESPKEPAQTQPRSRRRSSVIVTNVVKSEEPSPIVEQKKKKVVSSPLIRTQKAMISRAVQDATQDVNKRRLPRRELSTKRGSSAPKRRREDVNDSERDPLSTKAERELRTRKFRAETDKGPNGNGRPGRRGLDDEQRRDGRAVPRERELTSRRKRDREQERMRGRTVQRRGRDVGRARRVESRQNDQDESSTFQKMKSVRIMVENDQVSKTKYVRSNGPEAPKSSTKYVRPNANGAAGVNGGAGPVRPSTTVTKSGLPMSKKFAKNGEGDAAMKISTNAGAGAAAPNKTSTTKCTFWPNCQKGDACAFYHPKEQCKFWPRCTFGTKCMYVHPSRKPAMPISGNDASSTPCRYGDACFRPDCRFSHPAGRSIAGAKKGVCRFDARCTKIKCEFQHPNRDQSGFFDEGLDDDDDDEVHVKISNSLPKTPPRLTAQ